jgi:hypothetical protein
MSTVSILHNTGSYSTPISTIVNGTPLTLTTATVVVTGGLYHYYGLAYI